MEDNRKDKQEPQQAIRLAIFMPAQLIAGASHFGTTTEIMAGALYGVTGGITREDTKKRLAAFLKKPVRETKGE